MSFVSSAATVISKDLRIEFRSRELVYMTTFLAAMIVLIFSFALLGGPYVEASVVPGILWVAVIFSGTLGLSRAFDRERQAATLTALLLSPAPRAAIFLGKSVAITLLILGVCAVAVPLVALFFGVPLLAHPLPLVLALTLGAVGFSIVGVFFAAILLRAPSRD